MSRLAPFLDPQSVSLKVCGVTNAADAERLVELGVDAIGVNFWSGSPRHVSSTDAVWLTSLEGRILRVGVFVNAPPELQISLVREGLLDLVQLHGDETPADAAALCEAGIPFISTLAILAVDRIFDMMSLLTIIIIILIFKASLFPSLREAAQMRLRALYRPFFQSSQASN